MTPGFVLRLSAQGFVAVGAGYGQPAPLVVAPGQLVTVYVNIGGLNEPTIAKGLPLPTVLSGLQAAISGTNITTTPSGLIPLPILSVFSVQLSQPAFLGVTIGGPSVNAITVQIPFELEPPLGAPTSKSRIWLGVSDTPTGSPQTQYNAQIALLLQNDAIHIIRTGDTLVSPIDAGGSHGIPPSVPSPAITHSDGSAITADRPAKPGETVVIWAVGLGLPSSGTVKTGEGNPSPPLMTSATVDFDFRVNAGASMPLHGTKVPAYFAPGYVGLYQINVTIPNPPGTLDSCTGLVQSNVTINIGGTSSFDGGGICVGQ